MKQLGPLLALISLCSCAVFSGKQTSNQTPLVKKINCNVVRGVFEIGSTITQMKIAQMDRCQNKVTKILLDKEERIDFFSELRGDRSFSNQFMQNTEDTIKKLKSEGKALGAKEFVAVALGAFREARNGKQFIEKLGIDLQIDAQILTQQEEAALAFFAASQNLQTPIESTLIWDIGSSSQQMIHYKGNNKFATYDGKLGTLDFKNYIIKRILRKNYLTNELNDYQTKLAVQYAKDTATRTVKNDVRSFFLMPDANVVGIGDVLSTQIANEIHPDRKNDFFTKDDVEESLNKKDLPAESASRLALVLGYMKALRITKVRVASVNMTDGLLVDYKYWKP